MCRNAEYFARVVLWVAIGAVSAQPTRADDPKPAAHKAPAGPDIYDKKADGNKQIAAALVVAKRENKRVLLQFGANWCPWCHKLHDTLKKDAQLAKVMLYEYELVLIDVDRVDGKVHNADVDAKYGNPMKLGLPALVVLDGDGKQLATQDTGKLEAGDHHDPAKVMAFLEHWKATPQDAGRVVDAALAQAKSESKNVLLHFGAPWCGWCRKFEAFLHRDDVTKALESSFVIVKVDVDRMKGGKEMNTKYRSPEAGAGIPYFAVLDPQGKRLAESVGPEGNIGHPAKPDEIKLFLDLMKRTGAKLSAKDLDILRNALTEKN